LKFPDFYWPGWWGQHELAWSVYYAFAEHIGLRFTASQSALLRGWNTLGESAGWWCCFGNDDLFVCERPSIQAVDAEGRLHAENGPALLCRDGWPVHAWHGVMVPEKVIEAAASLTPREITDERNAEVRRVMLERFGSERYLREIDAKILDNDPDLSIPVLGCRGGILRRAELPDDEPLVMVTVTNSSPEPDGTFKRYVLRVPPQIQTVREAVAWTWGFERPDQYAPVVET